MTAWKDSTRKGKLLIYNRMITIYDVSHYVLITVKDKNTRSLVTFLQWQNIPFAVRTKWNWYYLYRAALLQVQYPKQIVLMETGHQVPTKRTAENNLRNKIISCKSKITEYKNKLKMFEKSYNSLFPIDEFEPYQNAKMKIQKKEFELKQLLITLKLKK